MHAYRIVRTTAFAAAVVSLAVSAPLRLMAQSNKHTHESQPATADSRRSGNALVVAVREATERFKNVATAEAEGYLPQFGCVSGSDFGAMGMHYVNMSLVTDGELDPSKPEIVIYEPIGNGKLKLIGADFLVLADQWNATHSSPPELGGQLLHLFEAPNRFGLPAFYTLHVWAWKESPTGMFVNWHANVSCEGFSGKN